MDLPTEGIGAYTGGGAGLQDAGQLGFRKGLPGGEGLLYNIFQVVFQKWSKNIGKYRDKKKPCRIRTGLLRLCSTERRFAPRVRSLLAGFRPVAGRGRQMNMAATYSPALWCSTIGHEGLNFSVRDGKR